MNNHEDLLEQLLASDLFGTLCRQGLSHNELEKLGRAYFQTRCVEPERYQSMVAVLTAFAEHLGQQAPALERVSEDTGPAAVAKAREFIEANLSAPLSLTKVARVVGLSASHFCRLFHEATGLTLMDYINRRRIQWAKEELLNPDSRVSEIAFLVGYQSLSQFNRSFARITGRSPTRFRKEELPGLGS